MANDFEFDAYQEEAFEFAKLQDNYHADLFHGVFGLCGESGEIAEKVKKMIRDGTVISPEDLQKELGDVLWYIAFICSIHEWSLGDIADMNIIKLTDRQKRGKLGGSGDNR